MDPLQSVQSVAVGQGCACPCSQYSGARRCLLKGCERWFQPARPQARYCSSECQQAACRWRRWRAARRYRATPGGQARRRAQSCRYRARQRECQRPPKDVASDADPPREGQRAAEIPEDSGNCACDRPGCYDLFVRQPRSPEQHFCSAACRQALRRVLDRERRLRARRRRGIPARRHYPHGPP